MRSYDILLTDAAGAGKFFTLNALFGSHIAKVGKDVDPETMNTYSYEFNALIRYGDTYQL